jgi:myo-inositol-1(or 4)-monophosphatase
VNWREELTFAQDVARQAGELLLARFDQPHEIESKGAFDIVSDADRAAEDLILRAIEREFPADASLSEERGGRSESARRWIVDPLDGTKNYVRGVPHFAVALALEDEAGPVVAVTHDPVRGETFSAVRDQGSFRNGMRAVVSRTRDLGSAIIASASPSSRRWDDRARDAWNRSAATAQGLRRTGCSSLDLAYVACGRFDAAWDFALGEWDTAGGILLVREAGGVAQREESWLLVSNTHLHDALRALVLRGDEVSDTG